MATWRWHPLNRIAGLSWMVGSGLTQSSRSCVASWPRAYLRRRSRRPKPDSPGAFPGWKGRRQPQPRQRRGLGHAPGPSAESPLPSRLPDRHHRCGWSPATVDAASGRVALSATVRRRGLSFVDRCCQAGGIDARVHDSSLDTHHRLKGNSFKIDQDMFTLATPAGHAHRSSPSTGEAAQSPIAKRYTVRSVAPHDYMHGFVRQVIHHRPLSCSGVETAESRSRAPATVRDPPADSSSSCIRS